MCRMHIVLPAWLSVVLWQTWPTSHAAACDIASPAPLIIDGESTDQVAPGAPVVHVLEIDRGENPRPDACTFEQTSGSCDDIAYLELSLAAEDDVSSPEELGYSIEVVDDEVGVDPGPAPLVMTGGSLRLHWADDDGTDDVHFTLKVWAVDRAGNRSASPAIMEVESEGTRGCRLGRASANSSTLLAVLFALWLARRRR